GVGHFVGAVAVPLQDDVAVDDAGEGLHLEIAIRRFAVAFFGIAETARVARGVGPGLAIAGDVAHAGGGRSVPTAIDARGVLTAGHFQALRRARELHFL